MSEDKLKSRVEGGKLIVETADGVEEYDSQFLVAIILMYIARGSGQIEPEESAKIIEMMVEKFEIRSSDALELITRAMTVRAQQPELRPLLIDLARTLPDSEKEDIALMALKVVAADGQRHYEEMEQFRRAVELVGISAEIVHLAFDRYFAETMTGK